MSNIHKRPQSSSIFSQISCACQICTCPDKQHHCVHHNGGTRSEVMASNQNCRSIQSVLQEVESQMLKYKQEAYEQKKENDKLNKKIMDLMKQIHDMDDVNLRNRKTISELQQQLKMYVKQGVAFQNQSDIHDRYKELLKTLQDRNKEISDLKQQLKFHKNESKQQKPEKKVIKKEAIMNHNSNEIQELKDKNHELEKKLLIYENQISELNDTIRKLELANLGLRKLNSANLQQQINQNDNTNVMENIMQSNIKKNESFEIKQLKEAISKLQMDNEYLKNNVGNNIHKSETIINNNYIQRNGHKIPKRIIMRRNNQIIAVYELMNSNHNSIDSNIENNNKTLFKKETKIKTFKKEYHKHNNIGTETISNESFETSRWDLNSIDSAKVKVVANKRRKMSTMQRDSLIGTDSIDQMFSNILRASKKSS